MVAALDKQVGVDMLEVGNNFVEVHHMLALGVRKLVLVLHRLVLGGHRLALAHRKLVLVLHRMVLGGRMQARVHHMLVGYMLVLVRHMLVLVDQIRNRIIGIRIFLRIIILRLFRLIRFCIV